MRHRSRLLVPASLLVVLAACADDPVTAPPGPGGPALATSAQSPFDRPFQGMCDGPIFNGSIPSGDGATVHPLITQNTKRTVGAVSVFNDDFNAHIVHQASGAARIARTSIEFLESHPDEGLAPWLVRSTGRIVVEKLSLQRRYHSSPVPTARAFEPLDSIASPLIEIFAVPWALVSLGGTTEPAWAGAGPGIFGDRIEDPNARYVDHFLRQCGRRVHLFNDINLFDDAGMANPDNQRMLWNILESTRYSGWDQGGPRSDQYGVIFDRGRDSPCWANGECDDEHLATLRGMLAVTDVFSSIGTLTSFPADVGVLFLWTPRVPFTVAEINALKQFLDEGGRIVYIGEHAAFYGSMGIATENQFLTDMGSTTVNIGGTERCGAHNDLALGDIPRHRVTARFYADGDGPPVNVLRQACTSLIVPSQKDFLLYGSTNRRNVFGASVAVDVTPISAHRPLPTPAIITPPASIAATSTGR